MVFMATLDGDCVQNSVIGEDGLFYRSMTWCLGQHWMVSVYRNVCLGEMTCSIEV